MSRVPQPPEQFQRHVHPVIRPKASRLSEIIAEWK